MRIPFFAGSTARQILPRLLLVLVLAGTATLRAATTNYLADFESFTAGSPIMGAEGWDGFVADLNGNGAVAGAGGNGVTSGVIAGLGQQGFVGKTSLGGSYCYLDLWKSLAITNATSITFSTKLNVVDSTNGLYDDFMFQAWTVSGRRLWTLDFDNYSTRVWYASGTNAFQWSNRNFANGQTHTLVVTMDMVSNKWSATLDGTTLVSSTTMTTSATPPLDLDSVDVVWDARYNYSYDFAYGDNYMAIDNFLITSVPSAPPQPNPPTLETPAAVPAGAVIVRLTGQEAYQYAIEVTTNLTSWVALTTNTVCNGLFDYTDKAAGTGGIRYYRARWVQSGTQSPPAPPSLSAPAKVATGSVALRLIGAEGYKFAILGSTNLQSGSWLPLTTNTVSGGYYDFTDTGAGSLKARYYRAQWVP